jgi:hypothetical protein
MTAYELVTDYATQCQWKPDTTILVVAGFLLQTGEVDPEKFTDATAIWMRDTGIPNHVVVKVLCEYALENHLLEELGLYLKDVAAAFMLPTPSNQPVSKEILVPKKVAETLLAQLKLEERVAEEPLGYMLAQWIPHVDTAKDPLLRLAVINSVPRPVLDVYVMEGIRLKASHPPLTYPQLVEASGKLTLDTWQTVYNIMFSPTSAVDWKT